MYALYKTREKVYLLRYLSYGELDFKKVFGAKEALLVPKMHFGIRGVLLRYDLAHCHVEEGELMRHGAPLHLLELWKESS